MLYIIHKINFDNREILPDVVDTPLWEKFDSMDCTPQHRRICILYRLISQRDNYFQTNTPTPFGNPEYSLYSGRVDGFLQAMDWSEKFVNDQIVIYKNNEKNSSSVTRSFNFCFFFDASSSARISSNIAINPFAIIFLVYFLNLS